MTVVSNPPTVASIAARLKRLPTSRWHVKVRTFIGVVTFFEAFDQLLATALPVLIREWGLSTGQVTLAITSGSRRACWWAPWRPDGSPTGWAASGWSCAACWSRA